MVCFNKKPKCTIQHRKWEKMTYVWFWVHLLAQHTPKSVEYRFNKFAGLIGRDLKEGAKIILQLLFLTQRRVLIKNQRALSEYWQKWVIFDSGCTGWQSMAKDLVNIDLPNLVSWLNRL